MPLLDRFGAQIRGAKGLWFCKSPGIIWGETASAWGCAGKRASGRHGGFSWGRCDGGGTGSPGLQGGGRTGWVRGNFGGDVTGVGNCWERKSQDPAVLPAPDARACEYAVGGKVGQGRLPSLHRRGLFHIERIAGRGFAGHGFRQGANGSGVTNQRGMVDIGGGLARFGRGDPGSVGCAGSRGGAGGIGGFAVAI
jgi:hypothetical protein